MNAEENLITQLGFKYLDGIYNIQFVNIHVTKICIISKNGFRKWF